MFSLLLNLRYLMLIASFGMAAGALLMFWEGAIYLRDAFVLTRSEVSGPLIASVMGSTDKFLFGIVLLIFAYAITFGFVLDVPPERLKRMPDWMVLNSVTELKHLFFQVIILYLVVHFATVVAETATEKLDWNILILPASIFLLAGAMKLIAISSQGIGSQDSG